MNNASNICVYEIKIPPYSFKQGNISIWFEITKNMDAYIFTGSGRYNLSSNPVENS